MIARLPAPVADVLRRVGLTLRDAARGFLADDGPTLGAALAFYTALSFAPLLVILVTIAGLLGEETERQLVVQVEGIIGPGASDVVSALVQSARHDRDSGGMIASVGLATIAISATGIFAQLQRAMNRIWSSRLRKRRRLAGFLRKRLLSLGMIVGVVTLLLVLLAVSATLTLLLPDRSSAWGLMDFTANLAIFTLVFAALFRYLPDVDLEWRDVRVGAITTAVLYSFVKGLLARYLGESSVTSAYGAAGSLVVLLLWAFASSGIVLFGAELTRATSEHFPADATRPGNATQPGESARR